MHKNPVKVFIVDDHQIVIEGIKSLLIDVINIEIVGCANTSLNCLQFFKIKSADIIFMDINLPDTSGIELCAIITNKYPRLSFYVYVSKFCIKKFFTR